MGEQIKSSAVQIERADKRYQNKTRKQDCYICGSYKKRTRDCTAHFIRKLDNVLRGMELISPVRFERTKTEIKVSFR